MILGKQSAGGVTWDTKVSPLSIDRAKIYFSLNKKILKILKRILVHTRTNNFSVRNSFRFCFLPLSHMFAGLFG